MIGTDGFRDTTEYALNGHKVDKNVHKLVATMSAELTEAKDLANHWSIAAQEAQHQVRELRTQLDALANQEPVAWMNHCREVTTNKDVADEWGQRKYVVMPLYTKPQPAAVPDDGMRKAAEFLRIERDEYRRQRDIAVAALEKVSALEGTEDNEWDCVERVTPLMATTAREALKEIGESK
jgi:hypothetical protein